MLDIPTKGFAQSKNSHNVALDVMCDWIEGSTLFVDSELSRSDVVDVLHEELIYEKPGSDPRRVAAIDRVTDAWAEIQKRTSLLGAGGAVRVVGERIQRIHGWHTVPAQSFCLALSLAKWYRQWGGSFGSDYTEQGDLFESLTLESMKHQFPTWEIHPTGWTRARTAKLSAVVAQVAGRLGETIGRVERWTKASANEAGLDLLCYRPFPDGRVGVPVFLMQCGSGGDWEGKLHTPDPKIWERIVEFASKPKKAFATPFAFLDADFVRNTNLVDGLLLDRYRLLAPSQNNPGWLSAGLAKRIVQWLKPRIKQLPMQ
jgi:hypothetical protein